MLSIIQIVDTNKPDAMKNHEIKDRIVRLLESVVERAHLINNSDSAGSGLEIDLMLEDLRALYRQYEYLGKQEEKEDRREKIEEEEREKEKREERREEEKEEEKIEERREEEKREERREEEKREERREEEKIEERREEEKIEEEKIEEEKREEVIEIKMEEERPVVPVVPPSPPPPAAFADLFSQTVPATIAEKFGSDDNSLHQKIAGQKSDASIGTRMQQVPLADIREAIGLNEKFLFINELFSGDIQAYNKAISDLNQASSADESMKLLASIQQKAGWDQDRSSDTIEKLKGYVRRRHLQ